MPTLASALAVAPAAELRRDPLRVRVAQDLDGACAVVVVSPAHPEGILYRCSTVAEVCAYFASGVVTDVCGDEPDWAPMD